MKKLIFVFIFQIAAFTAFSQKPIHLTAASFKEKVFNYDKNKQWSYQGKVPAIIDFYADWCSPCKRIAPILEELAKEYKGKIIIYKINTDEQRALAQVFGIQSLPSLLFVPMQGKPQISVGSMPKSGFEEAIRDVLKVKK